MDDNSTSKNRKSVLYEFINATGKFLSMKIHLGIIHIFSLKKTALSIMDANIARVDLADNAAGGQTPVWMGQFLSNLHKCMGMGKIISKDEMLSKERTIRFTS